MSIDLIVYEKKGTQTKIALLENKELKELEVIDESKPCEGNIYLGKLTKKLDLAQGHIGFLVDIGYDLDAFINVDDDSPLTEGQSIVVQISQEARAEKGAKVVQELQFVGSCLVYCPFKDYIQVSHKIAENQDVIERKAWVEANTTQSEGWILRTVIANADKEEIMAEMQYLRQSYATVQAKAKEAKAPALLKVKDNSLFEYVSKYQDTLEKIVTNVRKLEETFEVEICAEPFKEFGLEDAIADALLPSVKLPSGGSVFFEETKACVAIDVDSGDDSANGSIARLNIEAATIIAKEIRLRNLAGKIVIDFAGQSEYKYLKNVIETLEKELKKDLTKTYALGLSKIGLVELIRQRKRASLKECV